MRKNVKLIIKSLGALMLLGFISFSIISCDEGYTKKDYKEKDWYKKKHGVETADSDSDKKEAVDTEDKGITSVMDFEMKPFDDTEEGKLAEYGEKLIKETYNYFFDENGKKIGNELACISCHADGGTKAYQIPFVGLSKFFPAYMAREDDERSLAQRVNGCFERSMDGEALDEDSEEMVAILAYMDHLSRDVKIEGERIEGQQTPDLGELPNRAADLDLGKEVYKNHCAVCHMENGEGMRIPNAETGYIYPPLWGDNSYNDGAGMHRMLTAAKFIKANMPMGTTFENPQLTDEEAYDVAAYINSFERPVKSGKENDFPDLSKKPKDAPFPPYDDDISQEQHKYGPFDF